MRYGRLDWLTPDELDREQRRVYDTIAGGPRARDAKTLPVTDGEGRLYGPFAPTPRSREIPTLAVASAAPSNFEWCAHSLLGRAAGLTFDEIDALAAGSLAPSFSAEEALIWRVVNALVRDRDLDDELFTEARAKLGDVGIVDLIALVGHYEILSRSLRVWRTPVPGGHTPKFPGE